MSDQSDARDPYAPMAPEPAAGPVAHGPAPASVLTAVRLMFSRAALGVIGLIVLLATKDTLKRQLIEKNPTADVSRQDSLLNTAITAGIVIGIIFIVLYVLLALQVRKGKNWARIVTWVLAGLGVLSALLSLAQPEPGLSRVVTFVGGIIDIAIIVFLAQRPSNDYFRRGREPT